MKLKITAEKPCKLPFGLKKKWDKNLSQVKMHSDKSAIILLAEMLELLCGQAAIFQCAGTVEYGMFSGCDFAWTLSSGNCRIIRQLKREISESWQRVEVDFDNVIIHGLDKYKFSWNGECGETLSTLKITFETENTDLVHKIEELGKRLFVDFDIT